MDTAHDAPTNKGLMWISTQYSPDGAKATVVYDATSNCLTSAYKQIKNN